jgi:hypothetical protein
MKNPIAVFSSVAIVAVAALGVTLYVDRKPEQPVAKVVAPTQPAKTPDAVAKVEAPAQPVDKKITAVAPPAAKALPEAEKKSEVAMVPKPAEPVLPNIVVATPLPQEVAPVAPSFDTVRVEATGEAVIAGRATPQSDVTVKWNGNVVGTATANAEGSFVVIPAKALKTGIGAMTIEMSKDGKITTSEGSVFVVVKKDAPATVAKVDPRLPTQVVQSAATGGGIAAKDLQLTAVDYDTAGNIVFSGLAAAGSTVRFYVDNAATGEGTSDANGKWSFAGTSSVKPGTHTLRADAVDASGKVVSRLELPFLRESVAASTAYSACGRCSTCSDGYRTAACASNYA